MKFVFAIGDIRGWKVKGDALLNQRERERE